MDLMSILKQAGFKGDGTQDEVLLCVNGALRVLDNIRKRFGVKE